MTEERGALIEAMAAAIVNLDDGCDWAKMSERARDWERGSARSALAAISNAGYAIVPVEPTEAMLRDAGQVYAAMYERKPMPAPNTKAIYRAMISASPITTKGMDE